MTEVLEVDPEYEGSVYLSTLSATYLQFSTATKSNSYGWVVDWAQVLGLLDPYATYEIEHKFNGGWGYLGAIPSSNLNAFLAFSTQTTQISAQNEVTTNLPLKNLCSITSQNSTATFNTNLNQVFNYINYPYQFTAFTGNEYIFYSPVAQKKIYRCADPSQLQFTSISVFPTNNSQHAGVATNNYATTSDYFTSGVHKFIFKRLRRKMEIMREIDPEITGTLSLQTTGSNAQAFNQSTGTQMYTWNNIPWSQILGQSVMPADSVWQVTHKWESNALASQSINTVLGFPPNPQNGTPFFPVFFIGCNLHGNNSTPGVYNSINTIYCKLAQEVTQGNWYQFIINTYCDEETFVVRNPDDLSSITIVTQPSYNGTYTSNTGVTTNVVTSYPTDYYTNGTHFFTFRLLKKKNF